MTYAHIINNEIVAIGPYPEIERTPERDWDLRDPVTRAERGWIEVVEVAQPADTDTGTYDSSVVLVDGLPVRAWTWRAWSEEELAAQAAQAEYEALRATIRQIITDLRAEKARAQTVIDATNLDINKSPASYIKDTARAARRIADAAIDLTRLVAP